MRWHATFGVCWACHWVTIGMRVSRFQEYRLSKGLTLSFVLLMSASPAKSSDSLTVRLPAPRTEGIISLEQTLRERRSIREYADASLSLVEISQLLWAAQGITDPQGLRTAPSAGALYPLEIYLAGGNVDSLAAGIYRYLPREHKLTQLSAGDARKALSEAARDQECVRDAAAVIIITAVYQRTMKKYGQRGVQYAHIEVGCAAENVFLQAASLNLGAVFVGAFSDSSVIRILNLPDGEQPLALIPIGRTK